MTQSGIRIGKIFGINIFIDYSWFVIFFLITWLFSASFFPTLYPDFNLGTNIILGLSTSLLFFSSVLLHELMHSIVSLHNKIRVNKITLFLFGGVSEIMEEPHTPKAEFKISLAGPLTSLGLALLFGLSAYFITIPSVSALFLIISRINLILGLFNLLPGFPLDGGRLFRATIWWFSKNLRLATRVASFSGKIIASLIILLGIYEVFVFGLFAGIWLILIGLFLLQAAGQSYSELIVSQELSGKSVKDFLREEFPFVSPNLKVNDFIATHISKREFTSIPVIWDSRIVGYISAEEIERHNIDFTDEVNVMDIMKSYPSDLSIHRTQDSMVALKLMVVNNVTFLPVVARETIEGIITLDDMAKYLIDKKAL